MFNAEPLKVDVETREGVTIVRPMGEVDLSNSPELREALRSSLAKRPARLVVDMSSVPSMDSSAIATLIEAMRTSGRQGVSLVLCAVSDRVHSVLEIARLTTVFDIRKDLDAALEA